MSPTDTQEPQAEETQVDPVAEAKEREKSTRDELKAAKADQRKAKTTLANAEKAAQGKEGDELEKAQADVDAAKSLLTEQDERVTQLTAAVDQAKAGVKEARESVAAAKKEAAEAEKKRKAEERANRPKKAPMTLSQRRAVLKLAESPLRPTTQMNRTPLDYLVSVGLAQVSEVEQEVERTRKIDNPKAGEEGEPAKIDETYTETVSIGEYSLTDEGRTRAGEINPKWKTWKPGA